MRPTMRGEVLWRIQVEGAGDRGAILGPVVASSDALDDPVGVRNDCESAWNKDPVFGVIGIQSGPPGRRVHSGFRRGYGGRVGDAGSGDDREDPSGVFRPEQADQNDLPRVSGVAK